MLSTAQMVELDWNRSDRAGARALPRESVHAAAAEAAPRRRRSGRSSFPQVAPHAAAYRLVYGMTAQAARARSASADFIVLAGGRTEITFLLVADARRAVAARSRARPA